MQAGLTNLLNQLLSSRRARVNPVFRPEIWALGAVLWVVIAFAWGAL